ncbi:MAG: hypothetical protein ACI90V_003960 [Bacillariaceae sp.]|jgi:hypothetical protein
MIEGELPPKDNGNDDDDDDDDELKTKPCIAQAETIPTRIRVVVMIL